MYSVTVKDHIMIAHSLKDKYFGPAQHMHGATYIIIATFMSESLNSKNVVLDIGDAIDMLKSVSGQLAYQNLDNLEQFNGILTTTEFLAHYIHQELRKNVADNIRIRVELEESHIASASFED